MCFIVMILSIETYVDYIQLFPRTVAHQPDQIGVRLDFLNEPNDDVIKSCETRLEIIRIAHFYDGLTETIDGFENFHQEFFYQCVLDYIDRPFLITSIKNQRR